MDNALTVLLLGAGVSILTQLLKKYTQYASPLVVAAVISVVGGIAYAIIFKLGYWEAVQEFSVLAFTAAVAIYEIVNNGLKLVSTKK